MTAKEPLDAGEDPLGAATAPPRSSPVQSTSRPLLMVDIDGVISLFARPGRTWADRRPTEGSFHSIDGIPHFLSSIAAAHLLALAERFDLVWASGWEEKAEEYLPHLLGLPAGRPFLRFERTVGRTNAHWKLQAIEAYARGRALAWIDDALNAACRQWAEAREAPTLLVETRPEQGLTVEQTEALLDWAAALARGG